MIVASIIKQQKMTVVISAVVTIWRIGIAITA